ncbi:MAG: NADPH-dependent oxidoreductase [Harvfovirus sp.]|uniref:NADPH-dependent oxidoreductase n=1 Tax=Harvfovirus sp. TaxID=2487768 RepID=A0A3G5A589_9VIRU|nr:MAG: NADPH-dependent oxidoreductase [Harvfovirus sp.]
MKLLAFSGSTRKDSVNSKLINVVASMAKELTMEVTVIHLEDFPLPLFDEDLEKKVLVPDNVKLLRELIDSHDLLVISTPEYNGSVPAVLKNTIDWLSRDHKFMPMRSAFLLSASPSPYGAARAIKHLSDILSSIRVKIMPKQFSLPNAFTAFDTTGELLDPLHKNEILDTLKSFAPQAEAEK